MTKSSSAGNFGVILASFAPRKCEDPQKNSSTAPIPAASTLEKSMSMIKTEALLQRIPLFTDVPTDELVPIAEVTQKSIYKRGDTIIRRGHVPPGLVIILNGRAHELARNVSESKEVILDQYSTGDCLGFSGLIGAQQHPTSIRSHSLTSSCTSFMRNSLSLDSEECQHLMTSILGPGAGMQRDRVPYCAEIGRVNKVRRRTEQQQRIPTPQNKKAPQAGLSILSAIQCIKCTEVDS